MKKEESLTAEDAEGAKGSFDTRPAAATQDDKADLGIGGPRQDEKPPGGEPELIFEDGTAVAAEGLGIHQIKDGKRHWVPDTWTQTKLGITWKEIVMLFPDQLLAIPEGAPIPSKAPEEPLF